MRGKNGTSMGSVEKSARRKRRETKKRRAEERRWAELASEVTIRRVTFDCDLCQQPATSLVPWEGKGHICINCVRDLQAAQEAEFRAPGE